METVRQFSIVLAVMVLFAGALWVMQKGGKARFSGRLFRPGAPKRIEVIERLSLTPHHTLCLVRIGERTVLIGTAPNSCQMLDAPASAPRQEIAT